MSKHSYQHISYNLNIALFCYCQQLLSYNYRQTEGSSYNIILGCLTGNSNRVF